MPSDTASSWLEAANGADVHTVRARVRVIPRSRENHPGGNLLHPRGVDLAQTMILLEQVVKCHFGLNHAALAILSQSVRCHKSEMALQFR